jgi:hypothetical protein
MCLQTSRGGLSTVVVVLLLFLLLFVLTAEGMVLICMQ